MCERHRFLIVLFTFLFLAASLVPRTFASPKDIGEERERVLKAAEVMTEIMNIPENGIPDKLMAEADAIAVIPHVVKGAFGIGGRYGKGLVSHRGEDGRWNPPSFI